MTKIYTRGGDRGETGLIGGSRIRKDALRIETLGTIDELNATVGVVRAANLTGNLDHLLAIVQHQLFDLGAELAVPTSDSDGPAAIGSRQIEWLERQIDRFDARLAPLRVFILPGGTPAAACLHFARSVCRRAERNAVALEAKEKIRPELLGYLNRLSDLLFVAARAANHDQGREDVAWERRGGAE
ncbi:MAG: cob(I)yrinic acid a,c-diamide adenosyltransferase [Pirellulales bacterium]